MISLSQILEFLDIQPARPSIHHLNRIIHTYVRHVPWETVFRINKRHHTPCQSNCPRWPDEFWVDVFRFGGGGTCYENNFAFYQLLTALGYQGYLTINDMGQSIACHAASVILIDGQKYLVDATIPIFKALPFNTHAVIHRFTPWHTYYVQPNGPNTFEIIRTKHPKRNIYTLRDIPVLEPNYRQAVEADYGEKGLFLDRLIIVKVIDNRLWRFNNLEKPYRMEGFDPTGRVEIPLERSSLAQTLGHHFKMDPDSIESALTHLGE